MACRREVTGRGFRPSVKPAAETPNFDAYSVDQFCRRHSISVAMFYKMRAQGLAPVEFKVGTRTLISRESAAAWRAERELTTRGARHQHETQVAEETAAT